MNLWPHPQSSRPPGRFRKHRFFLLTAWGSALLAAPWGHAQDLQLDPNQFKAGVLSKLPSYVTNWPASPSRPQDGPIVVGLLVADPFGPLLQKLVHELEIAGRPVVTRRVRTANEAARCHILFVPSSAMAEWRKIRAGADLGGILTIGESPEFIPSGGIFNLVADETRRELEISKPNYHQAGVKVNSKLLRMAHKVD